MPEQFPEENKAFPLGHLKYLNYLLHEDTCNTLIFRYFKISHRSLTEADKKAGITGDFTIRLTKVNAMSLYPEPIRAVCYYDENAEDEIVFITNNFDIGALEVANLYRHRWNIEVFFKWIKQNIVVKTMWEYSENAVRTHLWMTIIPNRSLELHSYKMLVKHANMYHYVTDPRLFYP